MRLFVGGTVAVALAMAAVGSSQPAAQATAPEKQVTIVGCVQSEADYRRDHNLGRGGAAGTGAGVGNEFVIVNASTSTGATSGTGATGGATGTATGTAGSTDAYELTGKNEAQAGQFVGRRVEVVGKLKAAEMGATGPTGGATAGEPPKGVDVTSKDLKLRELEVTSVRETTGSCPATPR